MLSISLPQKPKYIKIDENSAKFEIEGCYPGYGTTLGNALRRVLLSSMPGAAITAVKIKGVSHEFSTIPNVLEDVIQIILNLKQVRFKLHSEETQKVTLKAKGQKEIKADMIDCPSQVEVINKDAHIATITNAKGEIEMEITIENGIGYVPVEQQERENKEVGVIAVDAIYTPIKRVNYAIENMRVGKKTDYEKITLEIVTDGSITPEESYAVAADILLEQFKALSEASQKEEKKKVSQKPQVEEKEEAEEAEEEKPEDILVEDLKGLSTRTLNVFEKNKVEKVKQILKMTEDDLRDLEGMGDKGVKEVKKGIGELGFNLKK